MLRALLRIGASCLPCFVLAALCWAQHASRAEERFITVASTTSTQDSGLFGHILPLFTAATGIEVRVIAVGTGQAVLLAERGDADVLLVHHRASEEQFVKDGHGVQRVEVMYNDFVLVGPCADPAATKGLSDIVAALQRVAQVGAVFLSRGDDSGTHKLEQKLWDTANIDVRGASGGWYRQTGSGMGATLNTANGLGAYTIADRATWMSFGNKSELCLLAEGDPRLFNVYGVILVNPSRHPHVKAADGQAFIDWLTSAEGQRAIAGFLIDGQPVFFPIAAKPD